MRECVAILLASALVGCRAPNASSCGAWLEDRQPLASQAASFEPASSTLSAEAKAKVAVVAYYMTTNSVVAVRIEGHGDGRGTDRQNYDLGEKRAEALREELVRLGVDSARLDTRACGKKARNDHPHISAPPTKWQCADFVLLVPPQ
jgi:outer membrane protein OmpA-like peptidoglycan-associated protein